MINWYDIIPMTHITDRLYVGGTVASSDLAKDNPKKITAVLNVDQVPDTNRRPDITYEQISFWDGEAIPPQQFAKCMDWLTKMYNEGHTILIHCAAGISRSVIITASFMYKQLGWEFDAALVYIKRCRSVANPASAVEISAKELLGIWPYDGSMEKKKQEVRESFVWMDAARLAKLHPNQDCPMKAFLLANDPNDNRPRHEIPCTCPLSEGV